MYDAIVMGGGPAGLAASIYLARQKLIFLLLAGEVGGKALWSSDVENYLGFHLLDGADLVKNFRQHLDDYRGNFELRENELVRRIERFNGNFRVTTDAGMYDSRTLLIATGAESRRLDVPGEKEFYLKGVTYCATCDAPLFAGKDVFVVGGGNSAMDAALFLEKYASSVTLVSINQELMGDEALKRKCLASPKIRFLGATKVTRIAGQQLVTGIGLTGPDGTERLEPVQGIFIEIGLKPVSEFADLVERDKWGQIIVDKSCRTSLLGIWAAGDVTDVTEKQIAVAVGEGSKAALQIIKYLQTKQL